MNPFLSAQTAAMLQKMLPSWAMRASCAGKAPNQAPWAAMFKDEVAARKDGQYNWPADTTRAIRTCAGCPVRMECLEYGFQGDGLRMFGVFGGVPGRKREELGTNPCPDCDGTGELPEVIGIPFEKFAWLHQKEDGTGLQGYPCQNCQATGRVRSEDRVQRCNDWYETYRDQQGWSVNDLDEGTTITA